MADSIESLRRDASRLRENELAFRLVGSAALAGGLIFGAGLAAETVRSGAEEVAKDLSVALVFDATLLMGGIFCNSNSHSLGRRADVIDAAILRLRAALPQPPEVQS